MPGRLDPEPMGPVRRRTGLLLPAFRQCHRRYGASLQAVRDRRSSAREQAPQPRQDRRPGGDARETRALKHWRELSRTEAALTPVPLHFRSDHPVDLPQPGFHLGEAGRQGVPPFRKAAAFLTQGGTVNPALGRCRVGQRTNFTA